MNTNENAFKRGEWKNGQFYPHGGHAGIGSSMAERVARQQQASLPEPSERDDDLDELPAPPRKDIPEADRELLELAALALGARFEEVDGEGYGNLHFDDGRVVYAWNSLQFSADTFELAVKLNLHILIDCESAGSVTIEWDFGDSTTAQSSIEERAPEGGDDFAATRRAVTRAAAEMAMLKFERNVPDEVAS